MFVSSLIFLFLIPIYTGFYHIFPSPILSSLPHFLTSPLTYPSSDLPSYPPFLTMCKILSWFFKYFFLFFLFHNSQVSSHRRNWARLNYEIIFRVHWSRYIFAANKNSDEQNSGRCLYRKKMSIIRKKMSIIRKKMSTIRKKMSVIRKKMSIIPLK